MSIGLVSSNNYSTLQTDIQQWLDRYDTMFVGNIPMFIQNAQNRIFTELPALLTTQTTTLTNSGDYSTFAPYVVYPQGWRSTVSMLCTASQTSSGTILGTTILQKVSLEYLMNFIYQIQNQMGGTSGPYPNYNVPLYYADSPSTVVTPPSSSYLSPESYYFYFGPAVFSQTYTFLLTYVSNNYIQSGTDTNMLTLYAYSLLFYGCLVEALIYLKDDERMQIVQAQFEELLKAFERVDKSNIADRAQLRDKTD